MRTTLAVVAMLLACAPALAGQAQPKKLPSPEKIVGEYLKAAGGKKRQVVRLEARLVEGFKIGGGLMASLKPGAAFAFEQTRLAGGVWLPRFTQVNASARVLLFAGVTVNQTQEFGDYKRFDAKTDDGRLDAPEETEKP